MSNPFKALSPTSFIRYLNCPEQVRLLKVAQVIDRNNFEQSLPMAAGTAFDAMVKCELNKRFKLVEQLADILPQNRSAIEVAERLMTHYRAGPLQNLKKEGVGYTGGDIETDLEFEGFKSNCHGLPDLIMTDGTVIDIKVNGAFSSWGAVAFDGYARCYVDGKDQGPHPRYEDGIFMEQINRDWAIQLYLYARLTGHHPGNLLKAGIEQIAVSKEDIVSCISYRAVISIPFQLVIEYKFHEAFAALMKNEVEVPHYNDHKCVKYKKLCDVAAHCSAYKDHAEKEKVKRANLFLPKTVGSLAQQALPVFFMHPNVPPEANK